MNFRFLSIREYFVYKKERGIAFFHNTSRFLFGRAKGDSPGGANGFRAEIFDRAPKVYEGTSRGSERK